MNVIHTRQPRAAQGAMRVKEFTHHKQVKRNRHEIDTSQELKASPWGHTMAVSTKIDEDRVNWRGIIYLQQAAGLYDPRPRLVRRGKEA